jgi:hypothetical protein
MTSAGTPTISTATQVTARLDSHSFLRISYLTRLHAASVCA